MHFTEVETHKAAKEHQCSWCGDAIVIGERYKRYRFFDRGDANTVRLHPECLDAVDELNDSDCGFRPGDNPRGCNCWFDLDCERCNSEETG